MHFHKPLWFWHLLFGKSIDVVMSLFKRFNNFLIYRRSCRREIFRFCPQHLTLKHRRIKLLRIMHDSSVTLSAHPINDFLNGWQQGSNIGFSPTHKSGQGLWFNPVKFPELDHGAMLLPGGYVRKYAEAML